MRVGLILSSAALLLTGCSTVRGIFGTAEEAIEANQTPRAIGAPDSTADATSTSSRRGKNTAIPSNDIKRAAKRLPGTLEGDSENAAHLGDPIPPR